MQNGKQQGSCFLHNNESSLYLSLDRNVGEELTVKSARSHARHLLNKLVERGTVRGVNDRPLP
eukprot:scaffold78623_cov20-Prasinocladus_malaysianus.AAC.2